MKKVHYFSEREYEGQLAFQKFRDRIFKKIGKFLVWCGITPNMISAMSALMLIGVAFFAVSEPVYAVVFLFGHVFLDALDGLVARLTDRQSNAGAFVDVCNDHFGILFFVGVLVYYKLVDPMIGYVYANLYTVLIIFIMTRTNMNIPMQYVIRSKYYAFAAYILFVFTQIDVMDEALLLFTALMIPPFVLSFFKIQKHL